MTHMFGWNKVATVAEQPPAQSAKAGNPLADGTTPGIGVSLVSVVRPVLNGLNAAVLLVEPPSAACHSSRSATFAGVAGVLQSLEDAELPARREWRDTGRTQPLR